jgi:histone-lysine N-methyltransferase SETMAR
MTSRKINRAVLLYEYKKGSTAAEASRNICRAFGAGAVSERVAQNWFARFKSGDETIEDLPHTGRPTVIDNMVIEVDIESNPRQTCLDLAEKYCIGEETVRRKLHQIGKIWKLSRWVPHTLTTQNKQRRIMVCTLLLQRQKEAPFLDRLVTCDEKWVNHQNPRQFRHWSSPGEPPLKVPKISLHPPKSLLCVWWCSYGIIHWELLQRGQTVTSEVYCRQLETANNQLRVKFPELVNNAVFLHDNARPHVAIATRRKLEEIGWEVLDHPPYSPDISPSDFHLFLSLDNFIKKEGNISDVENTIQRFFDSRDGDFYMRGILKLTARWEKIIQSSGEYF